MIEIDYVPGAHGNYLEFVLNKLTLGDQIQSSPFTALGTSHAKDLTYRHLRQFYCNHWFLYGGTTGSRVIAIKFTHDDLLALSSVSLLRAGDMAIDNNNLHINTYNKLNNRFYLDILNNIRSTYGDSIVTAYRNIKAQDWPDIESAADFYSLPLVVQQECVDVFGLRVYPLNAEYPDFDRSLLREFFKYGFKSPEYNGLVLMQNRMSYTDQQDVYQFPYSCFYDTGEFFNEIAKVKQHFDLDFVDYNATQLHQEFLSRQPQAQYKVECDKIIDCVRLEKYATISKLTLFQESYLNAQLELLYNLEMPLQQDQYWADTYQILEYINEIQE